LKGNSKRIKEYSSLHKSIKEALKEKRREIKGKEVKEEERRRKEEDGGRLSRPNYSHT
jgi:hypothetical protein